VVQEALPHRVQEVLTALVQEVPPVRRRLVGAIRWPEPASRVG